MTATLVAQTAGLGTTGATQNLTLGAAPAANDVLVVAVAFHNGTDASDAEPTVAVSGCGVTTWTEQQHVYDTAIGRGIAVFTGVVSATPSTALTVTFTGGTTPSAWASAVDVTEWSGLSGSPDVKATADTSTANTIQPIPNITTTAAGLVLAFCSTQNNDGPTAVPGGTVSIANANPTTKVNLFGAYLVTSSSTGVSGASWTVAAAERGVSTSMGLLGGTPPTGGGGSGPAWQVRTSSGTWVAGTLQVRTASNTWAAVTTHKQ